MLKRKLILLLSVIFAIMLSMTAVFSSAYLTDMDKKDSIMLKSAKLKNEIAVKLLQNHIDNTASTAVMACTLKNQSNVDITNSLQLTANFEMTNDAVKYNDKITALYIYPGDMSDSAVVADLNNGASSAYSRTTLDTGKIQITLPEIAVGKDSEKVVNFKIALKGSDLCGYGNVLNIEIDAEAKTKNSGGGYGFTEDLGSNSFILYDNINTADSNNVIVNGTQTIKEVKINGIYSNISTETAPLSNLYQLLPIRNKENVYIKDDTSHYKKYGLALKNGKLYGTLSTVIDEDATEPVSFCYTSDNKSAGTAYLHFKIDAYDISSGNIEVSQEEFNNLIYTGAAISPQPTVINKDINKALVLNDDYTLSYSNNTNAGTATLTIKGKGNYKGEIIKTYNISARDISETTIGDIDDYTYTGSAITPLPVITYNDKTLTNNTDYTLSYSNNTNAGTATITITGKGNYTGTTSTEFTILKADSNVTTAPSANSLTYSGSAQTLTTTGACSGGTMYYRLYSYTNNSSSTTTYSNSYSTTRPTGTAAGTYVVQYYVKGDSNHNDASVSTVSVTIAKASFTATVSISGYTYGGTKSTPSVSNNPGNATVTYYGRSTSTGTATNWSSVTNTTYNAGTRYCYAVIAATNNYNSYTTANTSFTISKASFTATVSISGYTYGGTKSTPSVTNNPGGGTVTYYGRSTSTGTATNWSSVTSTTYNAGTRYCYAVVAATTNYNSYTTSNKSFTISKASQSAPTTLTATVDSSNNVTLTATGSGKTSFEYSIDGTTWQTSNVFTGLTEDTTYTFYARYSSNTNYNASSSKTTTVTLSYFTWSGTTITGLTDLGKEHFSVMPEHYENRLCIEVPAKATAISSDAFDLSNEGLGVYRIYVDQNYSSAPSGRPWGAKMKSSGSFTALDAVAYITYKDDFAWEGTKITEYKFTSISSKKGFYKFIPSKCTEIKNNIYSTPNNSYNAYCYGLTISGSVKEIPSRMIPTGCYLVEFLEGITTINTVGVYRTNRLLLPNSLRYINGAGFKENFSCFTFDSPAVSNTITIPNGVISISDNAFTDIRYVTTVNIPSSVQTIGNNAFYTNTNIHETRVFNIYKDENSISGAPWGADNAIPVQLNWLGEISLASVGIKQSIDMVEKQEIEKVSDLSNITEALPIEDEPTTPAPDAVPSPSVFPNGSPSPDASLDISPSPSIMSSPPVVPEDTPVPSAEPTPAALPTPIITATPAITPTVVPTLPPTAEPIPTVMPTIAPTETPEPSPTPTATVLPTVSPMPVIESSYYAIWDNSLVVKNSVLNKFLHGARGVMPG